jgi:hypothetical protein
VVFIPSKRANPYTSPHVAGFAMENPSKATVIIVHGM